MLHASLHIGSRVVGMRIDDDVARTAPSVDLFESLFQVVEPTPDHLQS